MHEVLRWEHTQSQTQTPICFQGFCIDTYICQWGQRRDPWLRSPSSSTAGSTRRAGCPGQTRTGRRAQSPPPSERHRPSAAHTARGETNGECLQHSHLQNTAWTLWECGCQSEEVLGKWGIVMRELSTPKWPRKMVAWKLLSCPLASQNLYRWFRLCVPSRFCPLGTLHPSYLTFLSLSLVSVSPPLSHLQKFLFSLAPSSEPSIKSLAF